MNTSAGRSRFTAILMSALLIGTSVSQAEVLPARSSADGRIRLATYSPDEVYRLYGYVGYQIDLEFEEGEAFVGLAAGDIEGIAFVAEAHHLFLKPKVAKVGTNLTVLTNRRHYQFDYMASARRPDASVDEVIYAVRFAYPTLSKTAAEESSERTEAALAGAAATRHQNIDYWFCGNPAVKPVAASDDGVHTRLRFGAKADQPAIFVRNEDGSESLLNFSMESGDVVIHRVAHRFILRRGKLTGCLINQAFSGGGERLGTNTVSSEVERTTRGVRP